MRGIPSAYLVFFFGIVILIELGSFLGIRLLLGQTNARVKKYLTAFYIFISITASGIALYSFSNPEIIRQSKDYTFFFFVIVVSFLNLFPKSVFAIATALSYLFRRFTNRRGQLVVIAGSLLLSCGIFVTISYGILAGRYNIRVVKQDLFFDNLPEQLDGFRIVQLSDIHLGSFGKNTRVMDETLKIIDKLHPDLLLFTGDIVNNFGEEIHGFEPILKQFTAKYGKFAIQGNHDYGDYYNWPDSVSKRQNLNLIESGVTNAGFILLLNKWAKITVKDTAFALIGVENWGYPPFPQYADLMQATTGIPDNLFKILMTHDPEHWNSIVRKQTDIPLTLSGHTHGGQFALKIAGIEFSPIYLIQKSWGGLYKSGKQLLYVNRGLGTVGIPGRVEMRPEITFITLFRTKSH
ncbi:MAG: metallophosphoesterase [Prolixibacteraceae bacterium]|jgi:hypothetical protein